MDALVTWLLTAMLSWCPPAVYFAPYGETVADATVRLRAVAEDVMTVAMDAKEPPAFTGAAGRVKTALLSAAIGSKETSFQIFVDEGKCNQHGYKADRRGNCDGGHAFTYWQMHVFNGGYILMDDGTLTSPRYAPAIAASHPDLVIGGDELLADRQVAARVAQRLVRQAMHQYGSLCSFTGEPCRGDHPKADERLARAQAYWQAHPFTGIIPEPATVGSKYLASNAAPAQPTTE